MLCNVSPCDVDPPDTARHGETLVDRNGVRDPVTRIEHDAGRAAGRVQGEHGLDGGEEGGDVESFEQDLGGDVTVRARVERWFGQEHWMLDEPPAVSVSFCPILVSFRLIRWGLPPQLAWTGKTYLFAQRLQFLRVDILPYPLHIIPVRHDTVFQRISNL